MFKIIIIIFIINSKQNDDYVDTLLQGKAWLWKFEQEKYQIFIFHIQSNVFLRVDISKNSNKKMQ